MKLHLPIALLAAVVSAVSYAEAAEKTQTTYETKFTGTTKLNSSTSPNDNYDYQYRINEDAWESGSDKLQYTSSYNKNTKVYTYTHYLFGVPYQNYGSDEPYNKHPETDIVNTKITVGDGEIGEAAGITYIKKVVGIGNTSCLANGNKEVNITGSKTFVDQVYGGTYHNILSGGNYAGFGTSGNSGAAIAPKAEPGSTISINVTNGASVLQVYGGDAGPSTLIPSEYNASVKNSDTYESYLANPAYATDEAIVINIDGGNVGYTWNANYESVKHPSVEANKHVLGVICGAGMDGFCVNNSVTINISGDSNIVGAIYAGATVYEAKDFVGIKTPAYVNSTRVTLSGGEIDGSIYAGSTGINDNILGEVRGNTELILSGGEVTGNVYAGGAGYDVVEGNTKVVLTGQGTNVQGTINGRGAGGDTSVVNGDRILAFESYTGSMKWDQYKGFNALEFKDMSNSSDLTVVSNDFTTSVKIDNSTVTDSHADRQIGKLTLVDSGKYENNGKVAVDRIVAGNTAIIQESAPTEITKSNTVVSNTGEMVIGDIWNTATANNKNSQGYSKLTLENSGVDATMTVTGTMLNLGGETNLKNTDGAIFVNQGSADFNKVTLQDSGKYVNTGSSEIGKIVASNSAIPVGEPDADGIYHSVDVSKSNTVVSNTGEMVIGDIWNTATANNGNSQGYSKLTLENSGADATMTVTGTMLNVGGETNLKNTDGAIFVNQGSADFNKITSDDSSITNNGTLKADTVKITGDTTIENNGKAIIGEVYKMDGDTTLVNNKDMEIKNILNSAPMGQESSLNIENNADANLKITGGIIDPVNGVNLHQKGGTVELANKTSVSFNLVGEGNTGKLVHSGDGAVHITGGANGEDQAILDSSYVVEQSGNGSLMLDGTFRSTTGKKLDVAIKQTGAGSIGLDAMFLASSSAGSTFTVQQSGGGKVTVEEDGLFTKVDVSNLSTFENMASIDVVEVAVNGATLSTSGALHFGVAGTLALTDATLAVNTNSFTSSNAAILMYVGSQITSLDCDAYNIVFGQDTEGLDAMLAGEKLGQTFSVSLITGFDDAAALLAEDLCDAFNKDMLTLQAVDAKGQLIDLLIHDAELSFNGGAIVLSGTASVPEPTTATLSLLALAALAARRRRK